MMWENDDGDESGSVGIGGPGAFRSFIEHALVGEEKPLFNLRSKSLRPLCRIEENEEAVTVTFDLPYVEKEDITLTSTESTLNVEAKMRKSIALRVGGGVQRHVRFERYTGLIKLPARVEPERAKATFRNGMLRVKFPLAKRGNRVRIR